MIRVPRTHARLSLFCCTIRTRSSCHLHESLSRSKWLGSTQPVRRQRRWNTIISSCMNQRDVTLFAYQSGKLRERGQVQSLASSYFIVRDSKIQTLQCMNSDCCKQQDQLWMFVSMIDHGWIDCILLIVSILCDFAVTIWKQRYQIQISHTIHLNKLRCLS